MCKHSCTSFNKENKQIGTRSGQQLPRSKTTQQTHGSRNRQVKACHHSSARVLKSFAMTLAHSLEHPAVTLLPNGPNIEGDCGVKTLPFVPRSALVHSQPPLLQGVCRSRDDRAMTIKLRVRRQSCCDHGQQMKRCSAVQVPWLGRAGDHGAQAYEQSTLGAHEVKPKQ